MPTGGVRQLRGVSRGHAALRGGHGRGGFAVGVEGGGGSRVARRHSGRERSLPECPAAGS